ncbi:AraC family transcriptional regulator [Jeotgalibaca sp. MA1X17-3]|uniref:AraC family transcriptional regulator n=1 Tax=Jeotgalibaca sp. MA1X17-3 TaxID=2908211 RepID=UPI001F3FE8B0|nr:AraC family transcriptional regulator [Jeotgalibaca sp. MA1X17-3]UJF15855.1 AraC family transcriptional regulator [Jeotgalibaca sp. MA1X17-3]
MEIEIQYKIETIDLSQFNYPQSYLLLIIVHKGVGILKIDNLTYCVESGNVIFINEGCKFFFQEVECSEDFTFTRLKINKLYYRTLLKRNKIEELASLFDNKNDIPVRIIIDSQNLNMANMVFKRINELIQNKNQHNKIAIECLLVYVFIELNRCSSYLIRGKSHHSIQDKQFLEMIFNYIEKNYDHTIILDDITKELNMSKSHMSRTFKKLMRISIIDYMFRYRVLQSKSKLINENVSISEISLKCGFKTTPHYSRMFKKQEGLTPSEYRRLYKQ